MKTDIFKAPPRVRLNFALTALRDYGWLAVGVSTLFVPTALSSGRGVGGDGVFVFEQGLDGFEGFEDTSIFSESENAGGGIDGLFSGTIRTSPFHRRALLRVDLSSLPPGAVVESVSLELVVERSGGFFGDFDMGLFRVVRDWAAGFTLSPDTGGGVGGAPAIGDATWLSNRYGISLWDRPGGDFVEPATAVATAGVEGDVVQWSGTSLRDDVQGWIDDPGSNHGWVLISGIEGELQRAKRFFSSEASENRPRLTVVLAVTEGSGEGDVPVGCSAAG